MLNATKTTGAAIAAAAALLFSTLTISLRAINPQ